MGSLSPAVFGLLIANGIVFAIGVLGPEMNDRMVGRFAFWFPRNEHFAWWQVVTYMFMHGSIGHIFFNMFGLISFGVHLERQWGSRKFLVFYFLCGIGAGVISGGVNWVEFQTIHERLVQAGFSAPDLEAMLETGHYRGTLGDPAMKAAMVDLYGLYHGHMVGASGAIYGILVAFGLLYPNAKLALLFLPVPIAAKFFIPVLLALDLFSGVTGFSLFGGGIAHFAHLGGALIGFLLMWHWRSQARRSAAAWEQE
jgi:membrane associated rhomboid family serine protease